MEAFLSEDTFAKFVNEQKTSDSLVGKWRELSNGVLYRINRAKEVSTRFGLSTILDMQTREGEKVSVWAPDRLAKELKGGDYPRYIRSHGLVACKLDTSKHFYKYDLH